jgi:hypothetical protein
MTTSRKAINTYWPQFPPVFQLRWFIYYTQQLLQLIALVGSSFVTVKTLLLREVHLTS